MKTFTVEIQWDDMCEEYTIPLPEELIQETGWGFHDKIKVIDNGDGSLTVWRV